MEKEKNMYEPGVRRTRTIQVLIWCALILIQLLVIGKLEIKAEQAAEAYLPPRRRTVEQEVVYRQVEELTQIPETMYVRIKDPDDGRKGGGTCSRSSMDTLLETWSDSFSFSVTFHGCDADYFQLGDQQIAYDENRPRLDGCEDLLLELIGAPKEAYRITDVRWDGEPYLDSAGVLCRNALALGEKLVRDYQVSYRGMAVFPARMAAGIGILPENLQNGKTADGSGTEVHLETGRERHPGERENGEAFWKRVIRTMTLTVSLLLLLALILMLLMKWKRHREKKSERPDNCN